MVLRVLLAAFGLAATLAQAKTTYPATVEVDVLFPLNKKTYNNITSFPVIFGLQNAETAYTAGFQINWKLYNGDSFVTGRTIFDTPSINDFKYVSNNTAILPSSAYNFTILHPGSYTLFWEYIGNPCSRSGNTITFHTAVTIARGNHTFTMVDDGSGEDLELLKNCPIYGDRYTVKDMTDGTNCPYLTNSEGSPNPCRAKLLNDKQETCIRDYYRGNNETEACSAGFQRVSSCWYRFSTSSDCNVDSDSRDLKESDNSSNSATPTGSGGHITSGTGEQEEESDKSDKSLAVFYRPRLWSTVVAALIGVSAMYI
ncbi:hypothetical protein EYZ11_007231 [Aspergillus tanneri]|uniref:DUF7136 domain-containing protein n=1 Tax=Aspergillus tanneri TaxID=1220188 RepID=A0A4S3JDI6_9EURO|nr:uncharacterized protein ATNIH1004_011401 [Aspergillus tanneri]KAA8642457.1 hypothetical protein ATNIH1004_011401 [Aspergillus tanneri]THC93306.1 hypothetical protein EYZ11_007231 [Aspergillus tanneri]